MKILHVITGLASGGAQEVLLRLVTVDQAKGNHHHIVSLMNRGVYAARLEQAGAMVSTLDMPRGRVTFDGLFRLFRLIKAVHPDVVQTWMYHSDLVGGLVARLAGVKAIIWGIRHSDLHRDRNARATLLVVWLCARLSTWVPARIISCSVSAAEVHKKAGYQSNKFVIIPNGYAMDQFKPDIGARLALRAELGISADAFIVGMVARFDPQKDHQNLFFALQLVKESSGQFTCLLVGAEMDSGNAQLVTSLNAARIATHVKLLGRRDDVSAVMNALDLHVLSSVGEAFPNVLAEAMACGTPCVTTNAGDSALIVGDFGWVVSTGNPMALASGIKKAKALFEMDSKAWQALQSGGREHVKTNFELGQMCDRYRNVWETWSN